MRLPFQALPISLHWQVRCQLSTSFRCPSLISTAFNVAVGMLPALFIIPMGDSHFNSLKYDYRFVAGSLPRSNARLPFQRASPISTACNTATGALPALYIVPSRVSHFNRVQYGYRSVASSLPRCDARLLFQPLPIGLPVCCPLSTWFRCVSPFSAAADLATCSPLVSICPI